MCRRTLLKDHRDIGHWNGSSLRASQQLGVPTFDLHWSASEYSLVAKRDRSRAHRNAERSQKANRHHEQKANETKEWRTHSVLPLEAKLWDVDETIDLAHRMNSNENLTVDEIRSAKIRSLQHRSDRVLLESYVLLGGVIVVEGRSLLFLSSCVEHRSMLPVEPVSPRQNRSKFEWKHRWRVEQTPLYRFAEDIANRSCVVLVDVGVRLKERRNRRRSDDCLAECVITHDKNSAIFGIEFEWNIVDVGLQWKCNNARHRIHMVLSGDEWSSFSFPRWMDMRGRMTHWLWIERDE